MSARKLHLLLAPKERFEPSGAGAFALNAAETSRASRWRSKITVFGSPVAHPFPDVCFQPLAPSRLSLRNRNVEMARSYAQFVRNCPPDLIEIFNRPIMVAPIAERLGHVPIAVHFGNDPRGMDGSRSIAEREALLGMTAAIICVSNYIRRCFLDGLENVAAHKICVVHTGVEASREFPGGKENRIVYAGRVVPEKGVRELVEAFVRVLPQHTSWTAHIIGAQWFGATRRLTAYEKKVFQMAKQCTRIVPEGFRPHGEVMAALEKASISVVPSLWDDPFPRTALEALAHGTALVCSKRGGLPEIGCDRALFLDEISANTLAEALERLIANESERRALQRRGWNGFPFEIHRTTAKLDELRAQLMGVTFIP